MISEHSITNDEIIIIIIIQTPNKILEENECFIAIYLSL